MAQTGGPIGPQLVCVDALWCGYGAFGGQDCKEGCFCGDAGAYLIKTNTPNIYEPHCEWLGSHLAVRVGIPQISFNIVKHTDGNFWFGSQWKNSKVTDWWNLALAGNINFGDLADDISRIYALDLFIHNDDRHLNNYLVAPDGAGHKIFSFDYGRSWLYHGFPPPAVMLDPAVNTVITKNWFKHNF